MTTQEYEFEITKLTKQLAEARRDSEIVSAYLNEFPNSELVFRMNAAMSEASQKKNNECQFCGGTGTVDNMEGTILLPCPSCSQKAKAAMSEASKKGQG